MNAPALAELAALAEALEGRSPEEILAAAAARFPRIGFATGFGAEGCLVVDAIASARLPVDVFTLDTGFLFAQTYALWSRLEARYGLTIRGVTGTDAPPLVPGQPPPWERDPDGCCEARKVRPLRAALLGLDAWVTAIRRDQTPDRAAARVVEWDARFGLVKVNPLAAWTHDQVWERLRARDVPVNPLHAEGYASIGCAPCTTPVALGEDPRAGRWRGREKTECGLHARATRASPFDSGPDGRALRSGRAEVRPSSPELESTKPFALSVASPAGRAESKGERSDREDAST